MPGRKVSHYLFLCVFVVVVYSRRVAVLHIYYYLNAGLSAQKSSKVLEKALVTEKGNKWRNEPSGNEDHCHQVENMFVILIFVPSI